MPPFRLTYSDGTTIDCRNPQDVYESVTGEACPISYPDNRESDSDAEGLGLDRIQNRHATRKITYLPGSDTK